MPETKNRELTVVVTIGMFIAFALIDLLTPLTLHYIAHGVSRWAFFLAVGACIGQVTLIASWAVFAPGNIVVRLPWTLLFGLMMWYALIFGMRELPHQNPGDAIVLGQILLVVVTVLQIPLWIAKKVFRYRIVRNDSAPIPVADEKFQFDLRHLIIGTSILAVSLSPIRLVLPHAPIRNPWPDAELFLLVPVAIVADLIATLPCLWIGFRQDIWGLVALWIMYALIIAGIEHGIVHVFDHAPLDGDVYLELAALNLSQIAGVFSVTRIYYFLGYRLLRVPRQALEFGPEVEIDDPKGTAVASIDELPPDGSAAP